MRESDSTISSLTEPVRFGPFEFYPRTLELRRAGRPVHLPPKPAHVLSVLLGQPGRIVTREEIAAEVWPEAAIDIDGALNTCVRQIRAALRDRGTASLYIETLPRRGYRFLPEVVPLHEADAAEPTEVSRRDGGTPTVSRKLRVLGAAAAVVLVLVLGVAGLHRAAESSGEERRSLLVLPVEDLSAGAREPYLVAGLTEDLIASLARLRPDRLDVVALTSALRLGTGERDPHQLAAELDIDYVLEASVRRDDDRLRIVAQLIRSSDGVHLWADSYDRTFTDMLDMQRDVADRVAESLALELVPDARSAATKREVEPSVRIPYLEARHLLRSFDAAAWEKALDRLEAVVAADPEFAAGHAYLGEARMRVGALAAGRRAVELALQLSPSLAHAHYIHGHLLMLDDWDFAAADRALQRAIESAPGRPEYYQGYAYLLTVRGRHADAIRQIERAARLDPLSPYVIGDAGLIYYWARRYEKAIAYCERTLELEPAASWAEECILDARIQVGDSIGAGDKARELLERAAAAGDAVEWPAGATPTQSITAFRRWQADWLETRARETEKPFAYSLALVHADLGELERALEELERAADQRSLGFISMNVEPRFDALREHPRFKALASRLALQRRPGLAVDDGGDGDRVPVVFLHSLGGNTAQWSHQLEFVRQTRRAVAVDLPGHGRSVKPDEYQIAHMAETVAAALDGLGMTRFVLVGHSAGAGVAIACAARHPEAVAGLLLLDPIGDQRLAPQEEIRAFLDALRSPRYEEVIENYWTSILEGSEHAVRERVLEDLRATPRTTIVGVLEALHEYDPVSDLAKYDGPVLSVITPLNQTPISLQNLIDDLPTRAVDGTGHWLQLDRPALVNEIIADFVDPID